MSKQPLPKGHPLAQPARADVSPFDLADQIIAFRRGFSGGMTMMADGDDDEGDDGDDAEDDDHLDDDATVKVGDRTFQVSQLQTIMAREKKQGTRAGQRALARELGFDTVDDLKAAMAGRDSGTGDSGGSGGSGTATDDAAAKAAAEREAKAAERERKADQRIRRADLRGVLRDHGVDKDDLDDAYVLLDAKVDRDYDEDDVIEAVEALKGRRPNLFGDDDDSGRERPPVRTGLPSGGQRRQRGQQQKVFGAAGIERAKRKGWVNSTS